MSMASRENSFGSCMSTPQLVPFNLAKFVYQNLYSFASIELFASFNAFNPQKYIHRMGILA